MTGLVPSMPPLPKPETDRTLALRIASVEPAGRDTRRFRLVSADGASLPSASAGAHIILMLPGGIRRPYSLLAAAETPTDYAIAVRRETPSRGGSTFLHDSVQPGDAVEALGPRNDFLLNEAAAHSLLIGGGIGVTPLVAMARRLEELGRPFTFHAAFRDKDHLLLADELQRIGSLVMHFDDAEGMIFPMGETIAAAPPGAHLYCCGPTGMIDSFIRGAREQGRPEETVHFEYFTGVEAPVQDGSIVVELARTGITILVPPGKSILDAVREAGVPANSSCEQGTCGACETRVLEGVPDHFDAVLSPADRKSGKMMMICCSGAVTELSRVAIQL
jgi:vanillate O-demethylase ferredoxin subunit